MLHWHPTPQAILECHIPTTNTSRAKFFGGPAFSGAILFPLAQLPAVVPHPRRSAPREAAGLGTALRWTAALATIDAFQPLAAGMAATLADRAAAIERAI